MKKQIIHIFHNMIGKEKKADQQSTHETGQRTGWENRIIAQDGFSDFVTQNVFDKIMDQKNFERTVNDMLRGGQEAGCILIGDLDRFRDLNEIYGHETGDAVLQSAVDVLNAYFKECACISRPNDDIFALWIPGLDQKDTEYIRRQVGRVNDRLLHPAKELPPVSVSTGVAFYEDGDDCRDIGKRASKMLYTVKENGRCGCEISTDL